MAIIKYLFKNLENICSVCEIMNKKWIWFLNLINLMKKRRDSWLYVLTKFTINYEVYYQR